MKTIKVMFDGFGGMDNLDREGSAILSILKKHYDVQLTNDPDYIFYDVSGKEYYKHDCVRIFFTIEALCPDFNLADYGIGYENIQYGDRYFRCPNFYFYKEAVSQMCSKHLKVENESFNREFCSFVYSNADSDSMRIKLYSALSNYIKVESGGKLFHNTDMPNNGKVQFESKHKFSIACENSSHPGYHTEKIVEAFAAGTIPIYWGDPQIGDYFNEKAFINCNNYSSVEEIVEAVRAANENEEKYLQMLSEPALSSDILMKIGDEFAEEWFISQLEEYLIHIFEQPLSEAYRRNVGFWGRVNLVRFRDERAVLEKYEKFKNCWMLHWFVRLKGKVNSLKKGPNKYHPKE